MLNTNAGLIEIKIIAETKKGYKVQNAAGHIASMVRSRTGQTHYLMAGTARLTAAELRRWLDGDNTAITDRLANQAAQQKEAKKRQAEALKRALARADELAAMADSSGWIMIAGEESEVLCTGTRRDCFSALQAAIHRLPRDPHEGKGAWSLLPPDGSHEISGTFDQHCYY